MANIIGVRFKKPGKIYFFDPDGKIANRGDYVIVETSMGKEYGEVAIANRQLPEDKIVAPLKKIIRIAKTLLASVKIAPLNKNSCNLDKCFSEILLSKNIVRLSIILNFMK